jgi:hypothetical protein
MRASATGVVCCTFVIAAKLTIFAGFGVFSNDGTSLPFVPM